MPALSPTNLASIEDDGASSDVPDDSVLVEDGVDLALTRPFIFLGLTILGLLGILFLLVYCSYRIIRAHRIKRGGTVPTLIHCPFRIAAFRSRTRKNASTAPKAGLGRPMESSSPSVESSVATSKTGVTDTEKSVVELRHPVHRNLDHGASGKNSCLNPTVRLVVKVDRVRDLPHSIAVAC